MNQRRGGAAAGWTLAVALFVSACGGAPALTELQKVRSGAIDVVLLSPRKALQHNQDEFVLEFRSADGSRVDVGDVRASASMPMPGMPMFGSLSVQRTDLPGRYRAAGEFSMAGTWRLSVEWNGPVGKGSVTFSAAVQ